MRILVDLHTPDMLRLHVAPVGGGSANDQAMCLVHLLLEKKTECPLHAVDHLHAADLGLQVVTVATLLHILVNRLDQRGLMVGLHRVLMCGIVRLQL